MSAQAAKKKKSTRKTAAKKSATRKKGAKARKNTKSDGTKKAPSSKTSAKRAKSTPNSTQKKKKSMSNQSQSPKGESVEKIRDILFGEQMADYGVRFSQLETALRAEIAELKKNLNEDLRQSVAELKALVQKEKEESNDRNVARRVLGDKLQKIADDLRK